MDPVKVAEVCNWPILANYIELYIFLGFTNLYQRFIQGFSNIVRLLFNITSDKSI